MTLERGGSDGRRADAAALRQCEKNMPLVGRSAIFIDGANLHLASNCLGVDLDYGRLLQLFRGKTRSLQAFYYASLTEAQEKGAVARLLDWLAYNGYVVVAKRLEQSVDELGRRRTRGSIEVDLAVNAMAMAGRIDEMTLVSGNGAFRSLVEAVQRKGVRVSVVSTIRTQPPIVAEELRRQADEFIDLGHIAEKIQRIPPEQAR